MDSPLVYLTLVLALGMAAQWLAWKLGLPSIIFLLVFGFTAGQVYMRPDEIIGRDVLFPVVSLSVAIILFEGGLSLKLRELREAGTAVFRLCSLGALITWIGVAVAAHVTVGLSWPIACLLGAILVVTGPTVIAPVLRSVKPTRRISSIAKWEGIVIDPIGATLALLVYLAISAANVSSAATVIALSFTKTLVVGCGLGYAAGKAIEHLLKRHLIPDFLHSVFLLVSTAILFTLSHEIQHESGLLTVTVLGVVLANQKSVSVKHIIAFKENLRVLLISTLFIVLSGRVALGDFQALGWPSVAFVALVIVVVRPVSVFVATTKTRLSVKEKVFLSFLAPRGIVAAAVTAVFAIELQHAVEEGLLPESALGEILALVPLVFLVIVSTVGICGLFAAPLARRLGLAHSRAQGILIAGADSWARDVAKILTVENIPVILIDTNQENVAKAHLLGLKAHRGSILSEFVEHDLDLVGIGNLLAVTPNDEVNAMAAVEFAESFGRKNVYQFRTAKDAGIERDKAAQHLKGRFVFSGKPSYREFCDLVAQGFLVKKTELSDQFTIDHFRQVHGEAATILFVIEKDGGLQFYLDEDPPVFKSGQKIISLVPKPPESKPTESGVA